MAMNDITVDAVGELIHVNKTVPVRTLQIGQAYYCAMGIYYSTSWCLLEGANRMVDLVYPSNTWSSIVNADVIYYLPPGSSLYIKPTFTHDRVPKTVMQMQVGDLARVLNGPLISRAILRNFTGWTDLASGTAAIFGKSTTYVDRISGAALPQ